MKLQVVAVRLCLSFLALVTTHLTELTNGSNTAASIARTAHVIVNSSVIIEEPRDTYVSVGDTALLRCHVASSAFDEGQVVVSSDSVEWCKNDFCTLGRHVPLDGARRGMLGFKNLPKYFIQTNRTTPPTATASGDNNSTAAWSSFYWNLLIENVTSSDVGDYQCVLTRRMSSPTATTTHKFYSHKARLRLMSKETF